MSTFIAKVQKTYAGEQWENTYAITTGDDPSPISLTDDDLLAIGANPVANMSANATNPFATSPAYDATQVPLVTALLAFERSILSGVASVTRLYLTDGLYKTSKFRTFELNLPGLWGGADNESVYAGSVALMARRTAVNVGARTGRAFYRLALSDSEVAANGFKLVGLSNPTAVNTRFFGSSAGSGLDRFFWDSGDPEPCKLVIPRYQKVTKPDGKVVSEFYAIYTWQGWGSITARARQVSKGRKANATI